VFRTRLADMMTVGVVCDVFQADAVGCSGVGCDSRWRRRRRRRYGSWNADLFRDKGQC